MPAGAVFLRDLGADRLERPDDLVCRVVDADQPGDEACGQVDALDEDLREHRPAELVQGSACELDHEIGDAPCGHERDERVDAALEALRRLAGQLVTARRAGDRGRVEGRRLDEHVARRLGHLGRRAAHDPGDADRPGLVRDEKVLDVQGAHLAVQRLDLLTRGRAAHRDATGELVEVVAVHGVAELQHYVVRDVDQHSERAHARKRQTCDHPWRSRSRRVDAADGPCDELARTHTAADRLLVVDDDREASAGRQLRAVANHGSRVDQRQRNRSARIE